jgi:hypothetical protein
LKIPGLVGLRDLVNVSPSSPVPEAGLDELLQLPGPPLMISFSLLSSSPFSYDCSLSVVQCVAWYERFTQIVSFLLPFFLPSFQPRGLSPFNLIFHFLFLFFFIFIFLLV